MDKLILKIIWKCKEPRITKTVLKKNIRKESLPSSQGGGVGKHGSPPHTTKITTKL